MAVYRLGITNPRPYFAELPYYAWGRVNYDSAGDCKNPLDRDWTWMWLIHRDTRERVDVTSEKAVLRPRRACPPIGGEPVKYGLKWLMVFERQSDGNWRCLYEIRNDDQPPETSEKG